MKPPPKEKPPPKKPEDDKSKKPEDDKPKMKVRAPSILCFVSLLFGMSIFAFSTIIA